MKKKTYAILISLSLCIFSYGGELKESRDSFKDTPQISTEQINSIPDYYQRDSDFGGFPDNGAVFCGPTAASNALLWLAQNGYPGIMKFSGNLKKDQHDLIIKIASSRFINTGSGGSNPESICKGMHQYLESCGYSSAKITFYGWRQVSSLYRADSDYPDFVKAKQSIANHKVVLLNIGWYDLNERKNFYRRTGGHWVTMVGYGFDGRKADPNCIIIHDPETANQINDYIVLDPILNGTLNGRLKNLPRDASGYNRFKSGYKQYGIIEGMVIVDMGDGTEVPVS